jgi:hypothetical protein
MSTRADEAADLHGNPTDEHWAAPISAHGRLWEPTGEERLVTEEDEAWLDRQGYVCTTRFHSLPLTPRRILREVHPDQAAAREAAREAAAKCEAQRLANPGWPYAEVAEEAEEGDGLEAILVAAKLAGTKTEAGYAFRTNEQAAAVAAQAVRDAGWTPPNPDDSALLARLQDAEGTLREQNAALTAQLATVQAETKTLREGVEAAMAWAPHGTVASHLRALLAGDSTGPSADAAVDL